MPSQSGTRRSRSCGHCGAPPLRASRPPRPARRARGARGRAAPMGARPGEADAPSPPADSAAVDARGGRRDRRPRVRYPTPHQRNRSESKHFGQVARRDSPAETTAIHPQRKSCPDMPTTPTYTLSECVHVLRDVAERATLAVHALADVDVDLRTPPMAGVWSAKLNRLPYRDRYLVLSVLLAQVLAEESADRCRKALLGPGSHSAARSPRGATRAGWTTSPTSTSTRARGRPARRYSSS